MRVVYGKRFKRENNTFHFLGEKVQCTIVDVHKEWRFQYGDCVKEMALRLGEIPRYPWEEVVLDPPVPDDSLTVLYFILEYMY